ncbi:MAG TPA: BTAD domain-containing putative transcriptional regulator [Burkholderiales bacterium]|nr:BTAD domain-containing putative transcriptional regulator [Burkholderiales bacterium]
MDQRRRGGSEKASPPKLFGIAPRERLLAALDWKAGRKCVWIWAPPGSGKTALAASFLATRRLRAVWYQFDSADHDPSEFFYHIGASLPSGKTPLPPLTPEYLLDIASYAQRFFAVLTRFVSQQRVVVLDNYHELPKDSVLHQLMPRWISTLGNQQQAILISRLPPPTTYADIIATGALEEVDASDLLFTADKLDQLAATFSIDIQGIRHRVLASTTGWAAGARMLLEHIMRRGAASVLSVRDAHDATFNYFSGQVFGELPEETRTVLDQLAFAPRITESMAEALAGAAAPRALRQLYRRKFFLDRRIRTSTIGEREVDEPVYQFHPLLREFLSERAKSIHSINEVRARQGRCAQLCANEGFISDAMALCAEAKLWGQYSEVLETSSGKLIEQGRWRTVVDAIEATPNEVLDERPWAQYWRGVAVLNVRPAEARHWLRRAEQLFNRRRDEAGRALALGGVAWSHQFEGFYSPEATRLIAELEPYAQMSSAVPDPCAFAAASGFLITAMWHRPDHPMLGEAATALLAALSGSYEVNQRIAVASFLTVYFTMTGELDRAKQVVALMDPVVDMHEVLPLSKAIWLFYRANLNFAIAPHGVVESLRGAASFADREGLIPAKAVGTIMLAIGLIAAYDTNEADRSLAEIEVLLPPGRFFEVGFHYFAKALCADMKGNHSLAAHLARRALGNAETAQINLLKLVWGYLLLPTFIADGELVEARARLDGLNALRRMTQFAAYDVCALLVDALLSHRSGQTEHCRDRLREAMALIHRKPFLLDYCRPIPQTIAELWMLCIRYNIERGFVQAMIGEWKLRPPAQASIDWPFAVKVRVLGAFQVMVNGSELRYDKKAPSRLLELLKVLTILGGDGIRQERLIDLLWPDSEGDQGIFALTNALHRLRKLLGREDAVVLRDGRAWLARSVCRADLWDLDERNQDVYGIGGLNQWPEERLQGIADELLRLYRGPLLQGEDPGVLWQGPRQKAKTVFERHLGSIASEYERRNLVSHAVMMYERASLIEDCSESIYRGLMRGYHVQGELAAAKRAYMTCVRWADQSMGAPVSKETSDLARKLGLIP